MEESYTPSTDSSPATELFKEILGEEKLAEIAEKADPFFKVSKRQFSRAVIKPLAKLVFCAISLWPNMTDDELSTALRIRKTSVIKAKKQLERLHALDQN